MDKLTPSERAAYVLREAFEYPYEQFDRRSDRASPMVLAARQLVRNAVRRGQLKPGTSPTIVLDMLFGSTLMHAVVLPSSMRESAQSQAGRYLDDLVDTILAAFGADQPPDPTRERSPL